ncbi:hypothetical protein QNO07_09480 [Streptomyces sp. 549]|uniref:hypothetical protein n=1 Tax=Streptomyces sp. 549 TaxID=3049076 RepID=UPI0024C31A4C|nr:hypothetical protein [Streptomyces sp. 549]MDK1473650.1 hypothetical protein [Streptomyces sp. 549]
MSYDISLHLTVDTGGPQPHEAGFDVGNYTSNVARMWNRALGYRLADLHDRIAGDALRDLQRAVAAMEADPDVYRRMEPSNGWGDYEGALACLTRLRNQCATVPKARIYISH